MPFVNFKADEVIINYTTFKDLTRLMCMKINTSDNISILEAYRIIDNDQHYTPDNAANNSLMLIIKAGLRPEKQFIHIYGKTFKTELDAFVPPLTGEVHRLRLDYWLYIDERTDPYTRYK